MTPNNISEWNSGQIPADANNLADWTFDINEMADFDFGDIPQMAPVVQSSSNDGAELHDESTAGTAAINSTCSTQQILKKNYFSKYTLFISHLH
ncbi:hypothetical protein sscle_05g041020 [Sclerotinia sclerotiorum 1980 UF-70]|uniref:Uncharacterized protein n=1 Tax=Sclerotinia sclerotiorum (strain ATCC 18683 / 1980 / Ss-1) TaxID=665079 RepID=A0A1D9Q3D4_SCLS1|nr:hypothetical protein sscle_05g041020 [Sclerotinia sclerotiorum 1980 UF-70]